MDAFISLDSPLFGSPANAFPATEISDSPLLNDDFASLISDASPVGALELFDDAAFGSFATLFPGDAAAAAVKSSPFEAPLAAFPALTVPSPATSASPSSSPTFAGLSPLQQDLDPLMASFSSAAMAQGGLAAASRLNLTPEQAATLLASAERSISAKYPHLVPAVERLRASLHMAAGTASNVAPSALPMTPPTPLMPGFPSSSDSLTVSWDATASSPAALFGHMMTPLATPIVSQLPPPSAAEQQSVKPKAKVGRKRKERPTDSAALLAEIDRKRERNTEAARRARVRRLAEQESLHRALSEAVRGREVAEARVKELEARLKALEGLVRQR